MKTLVQEQSVNIMYGESALTPLSHEIWPCPGNTAFPLIWLHFFLPIVDCINGVPVYMFTYTYTVCKQKMIRYCK